MKRFGFLFLMFPFFLYAQESLRITKADFLVRLEENNRSIMISQQEIRAAKADFNQTNSVLLPNISISHTAFSTDNPVFAFGTKLNQGVFSESDFEVVKLNNPSSIENFTTRLQFEQPLINMNGIYQRRAAKIKMQASEFQSTHQRNELILEGEKSYMMLQLAYKAIVVLEKSKKTALASLQTAQKYFEQGLLLKADVLDVEVHLNEIQNQLDNANSNLKNISDYLNFLMNEKSETMLIPDDALAVTPFLLADAALTNNRSDIRALEKIAEAYKKINQSDRMSFLPTLNAFGNYELYDNHAFRGASNSYFIGAELKWNILQGSQRFGKVQKSSAEYNKAKLQYEQYQAKSQMEFNKAKRSLNDVQNKLQRAELAMKQSEESLRIRTDRFGQGMEKTADLLMAETQFAQKQLAYYQTIYEYNFAYAYLKFLTQ